MVMHGKRTEPSSQLRGVRYPICNSRAPGLEDGRWNTDTGIPNGREWGEVAEKVVHFVQPNWTVIFVPALHSAQGTLCEGGMYSIYQSADLAMYIYV